MGSPRIYTYKITFEEVPYYYYGVHKEKYFNEYYVGSPYTHKWCWGLYTPKKQILELFDYTDEGWLEAQEIEKRLIQPVFNTDKWCLNENCGGIFSIDILKNIGLEHIKNNTGIFSLTKDQLSENGKKGAAKAKELGVGVYGMSLEKKSENGRKQGLKNKENGTGVCGIPIEQRREIGRKNGLKNKENGTGIFARTPEQHIENSRKAGLKNKENGTGVCGISKEKLSEIGRKIASQKWMCLETGHISNAGGLAKFQRAKSIDTSKRKRIS